MNLLTHNEQSDNYVVHHLPCTQSYYLTYANERTSILAAAACSLSCSSCSYRSAAFFAFLLARAPQYV